MIQHLSGRSAPCLGGEQITIRLGSVFVAGNSTSAEFKILPLPKKPKRVGGNLFQDVVAVDTVNLREVD